MDPPVSLRVCSFYYQQLESLHVCSFHIPHMDPPVSLKCVFSLETTHGSTSVMACMFFSLTTTRVIACVFFSHTRYVTTSVIACVLFSQSTYGSTSVIACVFFLVTTTRVIEMCLLFTYHLWIHLCHCMCVLFSKNNQSHCMCVIFTYHIWIHQCH